MARDQRLAGNVAEGMAEGAVSLGASGEASMEASGELAANVMHFARVLRGTGMPVGPGQVISALRALAAVDITDRDQFYWALHALLVNDHRQHELFDQAFRLFWRDPVDPLRLFAELLPKIEVPRDRRKAQPSRRVNEALQRRRLRKDAPPPEKQTIELDASMTYSDAELLRSKDFAEMSADEIRRAKELIARLRLPVPDVTTRRFRPDARGSLIDMRATLRAGVRAGSGLIPLRWRSVKRRPPPVVALCDISGSMERYSHMLLHFLHVLTSDRERVSSFVFGTRLTNITRYLRHRDIDVALGRVGQVVEDWAGGTRIGACLHEFNRAWSRRVLGQGAVVLLITDGLDREAGSGISAAMERLHKSCRRLIWLNPLLRYDKFEPKARGIVAMLPHVDAFRPVHNLRSLEDLIAALR